MSQRIVPNVWCDRNAEDVGAFYATVFDNTTYRVTARYPAEGVPDFQTEFAGQPLMVDVDLDGYRISLINAGAEFHPNPAISFVLNVDPRRFGGDEQAARAWINRTWTSLGEEGIALMDIGEYPFSRLFGWVEDIYGVSWQLRLMDPADDPIAPIVPMVMFGGPVHGKAQEAIDLYTGLLGESESGSGRLPDAGAGAAAIGAAPATVMRNEDGTLKYADFRLAGQTFAAMDSQVEQDFSFTPGLSLQVDCEGQDEIDRLWDALSTIPAAEQCGWLVDRFGVSWQIVPMNMAELMQRPHAYEHLMQMKKLVIADF